METNTEECGERGFLTVMEFLHGGMEVNIRETFEVGKKKGKGLLF